MITAREAKEISDSVIDQDTLNKLVDKTEERITAHAKMGKTFCTMPIHSENPYFERVRKILLNNGYRVDTRREIGQEPVTYIHW